MVSVPLAIALFSPDMVMAQGVASPEQSVRQALSAGEFPWYNAEKDDLRPIIPPKSFWDDWTWFDRVSSSDAPSSSILPMLGQILFWLIGIVIVALVLVAAIRYIRFDFERIKRESEASTVSETERLAALPTGLSNVGDFLEETERAIARGNWSLAIIYYFSWQLLMLDKNRLIELRKGKTNRRYLRELEATRSGLFAAFRQTMEIFERAFFGKLPVTREEFLAVWEARAGFGGAEGGTYR